jgi:hypothetical protein
VGSKNLKTIWSFVQFETGLCLVRYKDFKICQQLLEFGRSECEAGMLMDVMLSLCGCNLAWILPVLQGSDWFWHRINMLAMLSVTVEKNSIGKPWFPPSSLSYCQDWLTVKSMDNILLMLFSKHEKCLCSQRLFSSSHIQINLPVLHLYQYSWNIFSVNLYLVIG